MKCLLPNCNLTSTARGKPGFCRKHLEERKRSVRPVRVILRVVADELLLCFPDREVREGRLRAWGSAGPKTISEDDYLYGLPPGERAAAFEELMLKYQIEFSVKLHPTRVWTKAQKKASWGCDGERLN